MKLVQLKYVTAVIDAGFNVSRASEILCTSQPGVSARIIDLEYELGFDIFVRTPKKITGLTDNGRIAVGIMREVLSAIDSIKGIREAGEAGQ